MVATTTKRYNLEGEVSLFTDYHSIADAKHTAMEYVGDRGYVMSLPEVIDIGLVKGYESLLRHWICADSSENVGITKQGSRIMVLKHGDDIWTPDRMRLHTRREDLRLVDDRRLTHLEVEELANGRFSDGREFPTYPWSEFRKGVQDLPRSYAIVYDFDEIKYLSHKDQERNSLQEDPLFVGRAGGYLRAKQVLDKAFSLKGEKGKYRNQHKFARTNPSQPDGRTLTVDLLSNGQNIFSHSNSGTRCGRFLGIKKIFI